MFRPRIVLLLIAGLVFVGTIVGDLAIAQTGYAVAPPKSMRSAGASTGYSLWQVTKVPVYADSAKWTPDTLQCRRDLGKKWSTGAVKLERIPIARIRCCYFGTNATGDSLLIKLYNGTAKRIVPIFGSTTNRFVEFDMRADYARARDNAAVAAGEWVIFTYFER